MPRIPILSDQSVVVADTLTRQGSAALVVIRAGDATPVFWSQTRGDLDGNIDAGGNPGGGIPIFQTDPPLVLIAPKSQIWARSATKTFLYVEVLELDLQTYLGKTSTPAVQPRPVRPVGPIPTYQEGWKGGFR